MRYTLRLLTAQHFQRVTTLICAAGLLRQNRAKTEPRYAGAPFRLRIWVDGSVTPGRTKEAEAFVENARLANLTRPSMTIWNSGC